MCGVQRVHQVATARTVLISVNALAVNVIQRPASVSVRLVDLDLTVVKVSHLSVFLHSLLTHFDFTRLNDVSTVVARRHLTYCQHCY